MTKKRKKQSSLEQIQNKFRRKKIFYGEADKSARDLTKNCYSRI